jgi:hypothetical protein
MYLEIDEGYFEHPKTLDLCARLEDPKACVYPLRLWKWACRSAKSGKLGKISAFAIEKAVDYEPRDGKCFAALCSEQDRGGFIDIAEDGTASIHDWMTYTGGAIARMDDASAKKKLYRAHKDGKCGQGCTWCTPVQGMSNGQSNGQSLDNPTQTRPDQTSPDKTSQEGEPARPRDPCSTEHQEPPANEPGKPTARNVVAKYLAIRSELVVGHVQGANGLGLNPQPGEVEKAAAWIANMTPEECVDIEPAIRLTCQHVKDGAHGWTDPRMVKVGFLFACIVQGWSDLREELHNCAPKAKPVNRFGHPEPERTVTHSRYR